MWHAADRTVTTERRHRKGSGCVKRGYKTHVLALNTSVVIGALGFEIRQTAVRANRDTGPEVSRPGVPRPYESGPLTTARVPRPIRSCRAVLGAELLDRLPTSPGRSTRVRIS